MNITRENIDELNAVVKVDIAKEDYEGKVDKILNDYRKNANIPGFRKGHVPMGMVKKQYGKAVLVDEVNKLLQEGLNKYLTEEKLDVLGNPIPKEQKDFDWDKDNYSFEFELGLAPEFEVNLDGLDKKVTKYNIVADEKMVNDQVEHLQKQYGKMKTKETAEEGDTVAGVFKNEEEGIENETSFELSKIKGKRNLNKFVGAKVGDTLSLKTKNLFEDDHDLINHLSVDHDRAHDLDVEVTFTINEINERELADLDQEFFDKLFGKDQVKSVTELKDKIKEDAAKQFQQQSDQQLMNDITEKLIEQTNFELPKEFLQKWIQTVGEKPLTDEEAVEEYEKSEKGLRYQLIEGKVVNDNELNVNFDDLKAFTSEKIKQQMAQFGQTDPSQKELDDIAARILSNQEEVKRLSEQLMNEKLLEFYKEKVKFEEKEVTYDEFVKAIYK
ncbi:MAG: trigger factor [Bacteroidota bacterium]|uniref:Cell division trigger factor n=1 Tax=Christiangramia flava JLT2011 TaxID=1229726 RepID=A0A1L7I6C3_9FLAO|nr:trigger factor [Christiangramia flava]APU68733.1 Cell division trigger factor [Christiangramia flava JLT2011]MAM18010.1 trigger factor [Christiangramia sp.]MEE2771893.1 trigger factor [Bacteroidota bacterium]OSS39122.1 Cell division trigger factor [Christiangramia flava JLT2011]